MINNSITIVIILFILFLLVGYVLYVYVFSSNEDDEELSIEIKKKTEQEIKDKTKRIKKKKKEVVSLELMLFRAGYYSEEDFNQVQRMKKICFVIGFIGGPILGYMLFNTILLTVIFGVLGGFIGYAFPQTRLEKAVEARREETKRYLPLVIEEISIGVSSGLDIGPCIAYITSITSSRGTHNPVTEMLVHVEKLIRSGLNLEDALLEVADAHGIPDVRHSFMFLAQCAKHGGEISKQLQELADSVMMNRQMDIEGKITALPVKASGPLMLVFAGFFGMLLAGLAVNLMQGLNQMGG